MTAVVSVALITAGAWLLSGWFDRPDARHRSERYPRHIHVTIPARVVRAVAWWRR